MRKLLKTDSSGFTLVELMVVVAIIGILSAIAVPNFKKYQSKSKQSEAKLLLAALYNIEVSALSDYNNYGTCLLALGFDQPQRGYYGVGFQADYATGNTNINTTNTACVAGGNYVAPPAAGQLRANNGATFPTSAELAPAATTMNATQFIGGAAGNISNAITTMDVWSINQTKALANSQQGF